ncbi:hypothetical protein [Spirosoma gilvum]
MNTFVKSKIALLGIALSMSLVSCNKDSLFDSVQPGNGSAQTRPDNSTPTTAGSNGIAAFKKYTLVKHGDWQLSYDADGHLIKRQSIFNPDYYWDYNWASNGSGLTAQFHFGAYLWQKTLILLDANGRAKKSLVNTYDNKGNHVHQFEYNYLYTAAGQLKTINGPDNQVYAFAYDASSNLKQIDILTNGKKEIMTYEFLGATDKNQLNPSWSTMYNQIDPFLPIFGKFSSKLMTSFHYYDQAHLTILEDYDYAYELNSDGMVTKIEATKNSNGKTYLTRYALAYNVSIF